MKPTDKRLRPKLPTIDAERLAERGKRGVLYGVVRAKLGLSQSKAARLLGVNVEAWKYRENWKALYTVSELAALREASGLSWEEMGQLIESLA